MGQLSARAACPRGAERDAREGEDGPEKDHVWRRYPPFSSIPVDVPDDGEIKSLSARPYSLTSDVASVAK